MNKSARAFYDLEKLKSIPIAEVAQAYGIEVKPSGTDFWCKLRDERTPSCKLYTKTNSFCDFGNTNYGGDTIQLRRAYAGTNHFQSTLLIREKVWAH